MEKVVRVIQAFKVSEEMHAEISALAEQEYRKITDQVRHLIWLGIQVEKERGKLLPKIAEKIARYGTYKRGS